MVIKDAQVELQTQSSSTLKQKRVVENSFKSELHSAHETNTTIPMSDEAKEKVYAFRILMARFVVESLIDNLLGKKQCDKQPKGSFAISSNPDSLIDQHNREKFASSTMKTTFSMSSTQEYTKKDSIAFQSIAKIEIEGKTLDINFKVNFSKSFQEITKEKLEVSRTVYIDPLVIQYDLNNQHFDMFSDLEFNFDIDNDGNQEILSLLKQGNGYLSLDKNNDGIINNGSELFGPTTNDGFGELRVFDTDQNNWIDENDPIFDKLQVWLKDDKGNNDLVALGKVGVGAIYLNDIASNFQYYQELQTSIAKLHSSSIFLSNDHKIGLINSINYATS